VAVLGSIAIQFIAGIVGRIAISSWGIPAESTLVYYLLLLLRYVPKEAGFVVAGAKTAPPGRLVTAIVLAVVRVLMSLIAHIVRQTNPGVGNYTHFAAESMGSALGLAYNFFSKRTRRASKTRLHMRTAYLPGNSGRGDRARDPIERAGPIPRGRDQRRSAGEWPHFTAVGRRDQAV
jgi:hypothetical protein